MDTIVRNSAARLSVLFADGDTPTDADGPVTVAVLDGTGASLGAGVAVRGATPGLYTFLMPPQAALGTLSLVWRGSLEGLPLQVTTRVEVVGNLLLTLAECRSIDKTLADTDKYPAAFILEKRAEVQAEFERILNFSLVPRAGYAELDGVNRSWLTLPDVFVSAVTGVSLVTGTDTWQGDAPANIQTQVWTGAQLTDITVKPTGRIERRDGTVFPTGSGNVRVSYEHGLADVPDDLKRAARKRLLSLALQQNTAIPERATSWVAAEGGNFTLATPGRNGSFTGIPEVDAVLARYVIPRGIA